MTIEQHSDDDAFDGLYPISADGKTWLWATVGTLRWEMGRTGSGCWVSCEAGTVTDLASIPAWARWLFNPYDPQTAEPAVRHDELLRQGFDLHVAAGEFYRALRATGVPLWKRVIYFLAVVIGIDNW